MRVAEPFSTASSDASRPRDNELDLFGITHPGRVRRENQDHFLLCTIHPQVVIHGTSLPHSERLPLRGQRLATIMLVADGVGGATAGADASRIATESIMRYVASTLRCYHTAGRANDDEFLGALRAAAAEAHEAVRADSVARHHGETTATTLTLGIVVWPWLYVLQVGDSRCYYYESGVLQQVTRDQTVAQDLVDKGLLQADQAKSSPFRHVLSSAIGSEERIPVVSRVDIRNRGVVLVCSDGLTKHVSDREIAERLGGIISSEQVARDLVELALARGGTDNITIVVGRARKLREGMTG